MLSSICSWRLSILPGVKLRSRAVDRLELAAVDGDHGLGEQLELAAQLDEAAADVADADRRCRAGSRRWS